MITFDELEKWRTKQEMKDFYNEIIAKTELDEELKAKARIKDKTTLYKQLFEEYYPLMAFAELNYKNVDIECRYVGRITQENNIKYDGEIKYNGEIINIEITGPRDGENENIHMNQLNKSGSYDPEISDLKSEFQRIKDQVIECAQKKANKNYEGVQLVICFTESYYCKIDPTKSFSLKVINELIQELKKIQYSSKKVFFLIPSFDTNNKKFGGIIYNIK